MMVEVLIFSLSYQAKENLKILYQAIMLTRLKDWFA